jgi:anti-anti-sigma factor
MESPMATIVQTGEEQRTLVIEGEMTIYAAAELKQRLQDALAGGQSVEVVLARASEMDTAGLQLLLAGKREAERAGRTFRLKAPGEAVGQVLELCGLADHFRESGRAAP